MILQIIVVVGTVWLSHAIVDGLIRLSASITDPHLYFDVNLTGTLNLLQETREHGIEGFALASTPSVYRDTGTIPFVETGPCDRPLAPYAASKRAAEMLGLYLSPPF